MATQRDIEAETDSQNDPIRRELKDVSEKIEKQSVYISEEFTKVNEEFTKFNEKFDKIDEKFDKIDEKFDKIDEKFDKIDEKFDKIDEKFDKIDHRFEAIEGNMSRSEAARSNGNAVRGWSKINPVPTFHPLAPPGERFKMPSFFPDRVRNFWRLQKPEKRSKLIELLKFYNVTIFANWKNDLFDVSDDEQQEQVPASSDNLERLVAENPLLALSCLAEELGLNFDNIKLNMDMADNWKQLNTARSKKRTRDVGENRKEVAHPSKQSRREADDNRKISNKDTPLSPSVMGERGSIPDRGKTRDHSDEISLSGHRTESIKAPGSASSQKDSSMPSTRQYPSEVGGDTERLSRVSSGYKPYLISGVGGDTERLSSTSSDSKSNRGKQELRKTSH